MPLLRYRNIYSATGKSLIYKSLTQTWKEENKKKESTSDKHVIYFHIFYADLQIIFLWLPPHRRFVFLYNSFWLVIFIFLWTALYLNKFNTVHLLWGHFYIQSRSGFEVWIFYPSFRWHLSFQPPAVLFYLTISSSYFIRDWRGRFHLKPPAANF